MKKACNLLPNSSLFCSVFSVPQWFYSSSIAMLTILLMICSGCKKKDPSFESIMYITGKEMGSSFEIAFRKPLDKTEAERAQNIIDGAFREIHAIYNLENPQSELAKLNALKANQSIPISHELETFLFSIQSIVKLTQDCFDPSSTGWRDIHIRNGLFYKDKDQTHINLNSVLKGHAIDLLTERLSRAGFRNILVTLGKNSRAAGKSPQNTFWVIKNILGENALTLNNQAIAFSKDSFVRTKNGALADAVATCLNTFSSDKKTKEWLAEVKARNPNIEVIKIKG